MSKIWHCSNEILQIVKPKVTYMVFVSRVHSRFIFYVFGNDHKFEYTYVLAKLLREPTKISVPKVG